MKKIVLLIFIIIQIPLLIFISKKQNDFSSQIRQCNAVETNFRFSCYRAVIDNFYKGDMKGFAKELKNHRSLSFEASYTNNGKVSYAIFGTNCHTFYHAAGDFFATYSNEDLKTILNYGPTTCTNGYVMGVYKRLALKGHFSTDLLKRFYKVCKVGAENQCAHEIGHILDDKYSYSILKTLDEITTSKYHISYPQRYNYVVFQNKIQPDLDKPFEECKALMPDENKLAQCFTGIGHNLFLYSEFAKDGYKSMFSNCSKISEKNKNDCYAFLIYRIGINESAARFLSHDFEEGRKVCNNVVALADQPNLMEHCYRGIGGGIGLFVDSEYALADINEMNVEKIKGQLLDYLKLCEQSDDKFVDSCFAGLFGTKFAKFYDLLKINYDKIEELKPNWDSDFEVVG